MIQAELKGKLPEIENSEDILTSCVFGLVNYLPPKKGLFKILEKTKDYSGKSKNIFKTNPNLERYDEVSYHFWEYSSKYGEPDLILILKSSDSKLSPLIFVIEVKYFSSKSRIRNEDQLKDYFLAISNQKGRLTFNNSTISNFEGKFGGLIYLTYFTQKKEVEYSINELSKEWVGDCRSKIYELRWNEITNSIKKIPQSELTDQEAKICDDILFLLKKKTFVDFEGWTTPPPFHKGHVFFENVISFSQIPHSVLLTLKTFNKNIFYTGGNQNE